MLDTNSFAFTQFANEGAHDFAAASSNFNGIFHNQAGDLHTPGMAFQAGTPLSNDNSHPGPAMDTQGFHPHLLHPQTFHTTNDLEQQRTYAPSSFVHQDSEYQAVQHTIHETTGSKPGVSAEEQDISRLEQYPGSLYDNIITTQPLFQDKYQLSNSLLTESELIHIQRLRYRVTLNAPTAMVRSATEIPISYLNKGQAYAISVSDSIAPYQTIGPVKYRTIIRISFEDEQQRQRPSACWQLWKEGRGLAEAHQRGGRLQAVEYVDPSQNGDGEKKGPKVELDMASFDSFAVIWSPVNGSSTAGCTVAVRFNFLSTDFSHSKGVKGIPVRLCAKTELISSGTPESPPGSISEVCFCKVKLFRDHGAERKLSNDIAHIKKTIDKLKQQVSQVDAGAKDVGKRKRSDPVARQPASHKPGKVQKHKRTWSVSSQGSNGRPAVEDNLHTKLATMQDMFSSTRPVSVLYLRGAKEDDPDLYPVALPGEPIDLTKLDPVDRRTSLGTEKLSGESTPINTRSPTSTHSGPVSRKPQEQLDIQKPIQFADQPQLQTDWDHFTHISNLDSAFSPTSRVARNSTNNNMSHWIEATGVDHSYSAPQEKPVKPVACIYILLKKPGDKPQHDCYKAVYLMERTTQHLIQGISVKCGFDAGAVTRVVRINSRGLKIMVDDEVTRQIPEAQDMIVEFAETEIDGRLKQEPSSGGTTPKASDFNLNNPSWAQEMRLIF